MDFVFFFSKTLNFLRENVLLKYTSEWKPIHVSNPGAMLALNMNQPERRNIAFYADEFLKKLISIKLLTLADSKNVVKVSNSILKLEDEEDVDQRIDAVLIQLQQAGLGDVGYELLRLVSRKVSAQPQMNDCDAVQVEDENQTVVIDCPPASKKRRADGRFDVDRDLSKLSDTRSKLAKIQKISQDAAGRRVCEFTPAFRLFHYSIVLPIMKCLTEHCHSDEEEFIRRWGKSFSHSNWKKNKCPGSSSNNQCGFKEK